MAPFLTEGVITALITAASTGAAAIISVILSSRLTLYRIQQLEKKMDKHNGFMERLAVAERDIKSAHKRIDGID